jgi:NADH dehydrogenase (ubiquinone) 1 alpha subcomplex subunit 2
MERESQFLHRNFFSREKKNKKKVLAIMSWRGRLSRNMQELRFAFCPRGASSEGSRAFLQNNYAELKLLNPGLPMLVRDGLDFEPRVYARYDRGVETHIDVTNMTEENISKAIEQLCKQGETMPRSDESVPHDADVVQHYPDDPNVYAWRPALHTRHIE